MVNAAAVSPTLSAATLSRAGGLADHHACAVFENRRGEFCVVLADGQTNERCGGEQTSQRAVLAVQAAFAQQAGLESATVRSYLHAAQGGWQTTVVVLLMDAGQAIWAQSGAARLYHIRAGAIVFQTGAYCVPQRLINAGDFPSPSLGQNANLSQRPDELDDLRLTVLPEPVALQPDDAFLLCSDGLSRSVTELEMIADRLKTARPEEWLELLEYRMLSRASADPGNYSAIAVWVAA